MATSNNYTARIRAKLDSADLQKQIDSISKSAKPIKIELKMDTNIQTLLNDISSKIGSASKGINIKANIDTKQAESGLGNLQKEITRFGEEGKKSVEKIFKSTGQTFDTITSKIDGQTKKITEYYSSATKRVEQENKRISQIESQINAEIQKTKTTLSQMNSESSMRYQLEQKLSALEKQGTSEQKLSAAKSLTAETRDWAEVSKRVLETQQKITQEQRNQEKAQASASNKNQEKQYKESLALNKQIDAELQKIQTRMSEINVNAKKRAELEQQIAKATSMQNGEKKLQELKNVNTQITAMGKNAMSLGAMLQTAYEKFANDIATLYRNVY